MPPKAAKGAAKGAAKKKNGYQMPEKFDEGTNLTDMLKGHWTLGKPIGQGGFGLIYLAFRGENVKAKSSDDAQFVIKIEPKDNGPLFNEHHFYVNCAKEDSLKEFVKTAGLKHLAIPRFIATGLVEYNSNMYRFLVMDRFAKELQCMINQLPGHQLNEVGSLCLMRQLLYALEFMHSKGYTHGDVKGANVMIQNDSQSYLVDFGLAVRFMRDGVHTKYEVKPEKRHNGTIEYTSRDAHHGASVYRRSDLEILGYCMIHWLSGTLPWIDLIKSPEQVQQSKEKNMKNVKEFIGNTLGKADSISDSVKLLVEFYLNEVNKLQFDTEPPYAKIHTKITETLKSLGHSSSAGDNFKLFSVKAASKTPSKKKINVSDEPDLLNESSGKRRKVDAKKVASSYVESDHDEEEEEVEEEKVAKTKKTKTPVGKAKSKSSSAAAKTIDDASTSSASTARTKKMIAIPENLELDDDDLKVPIAKSLLIDEFEPMATSTLRRGPKKTANNENSEPVTTPLVVAPSKSKMTSIVESGGTFSSSPSVGAKKTATPAKSVREVTPAAVQTPPSKKDNVLLMVSTGSGSRAKQSDKKKYIRDQQEESESDDSDASDDEYLNKKPTASNGHIATHHHNRNRQQENVLRVRAESNFVVSDEKVAAPSTPASSHAPTSKYSLRTPTSTSKAHATSEASTTSSGKMNSAQLDVLGRFRNRGGAAAAAPVVQSPLALLHDTDLILVKKRKNVSRVDVAIQTDQSYLMRCKQINKKY